MEPLLPNAGQCGNYRIIKTLGEGATAKVKLAAALDGRLVAIKRFKQDVLENQQIRNEIAVMRELHHPNLVELFEMMDKVSYTNESGETYEAYCMVIELVSEGELFDYIVVGRFSETMARNYLKMLLDGLRYMHGKGYCHRDIKPENLLLNSEYILKIADFGLSTKLAGVQGDGILKDRIGTPGYMSPQIYLLRYRGEPADIFAMGVVLFMMFSGHPPFQTAIVSDPYFKLIKDRKLEMFWSFHSRRKPADFYPTDFKNLIEGMLACNPEERFTLNKIFEHPWFLERELMSQQELKQDFMRRKETIQQQKMRVKKLKEEKRSARNRAIFNRGQQNRDSLDDNCLTFLDMYQKEEKQERQLSTKQSITPKDFVLKEDPTIFFSALLAYLHQRVTLTSDNQLIKFIPSFKIAENKITVIYLYDYEGTEQTVVLTIDIALTKDKNVCMTIKQTEGNDLYGKCLINKIKEEFYYCEAITNHN